MEDHEVIEVFVGGGARRAFGPRLHVEGDGLFLDGWWQTAFRIAPGAFILRNEEGPRGSGAVQEVAAELAAHGLCQVGVDLPAVTAITYTELTLGSVSWTVWAPTLASAEGALAARVGGDSFFEETAPEDPALVVDLSTELGGARRLAGLPAALVLTVGLGTATADQLQAALPDCRVDARPLAGLAPRDCGALLPTLVLVDAQTRAGEDFILELRSVSAQGVPVMAVTRRAETPLGADLSLDPSGAVGGWVDPIRSLLG